MGILLEYGWKPVLTGYLNHDPGLIVFNGLAFGIQLLELEAAFVGVFFPGAAGEGFDFYFPFFSEILSGLVAD